MNESFASNLSIDRGSFIRTMALGCIDAFITLPRVILEIVLSSQNGQSFGFYPGWRFVHSDWGPNQVPASGVGGWTSSFWANFFVRWLECSNVALAAIVFVLFGLSREARRSYIQCFWFLLKLVGHNRQTSSQQPHTLSLHFHRRSTTIDV